MKLNCKIIFVRYTDKKLSWYYYFYYCKIDDNIKIRKNRKLKIYSFIENIRIGEISGSLCGWCEQELEE